MGGQLLLWEGNYCYERTTTVMGEQLLLWEGNYCYEWAITVMGGQLLLRDDNYCYKLIKLIIHFNTILYLSFQIQPRDPEVYGSTLESSSVWDVSFLELLHYLVIFKEGVSVHEQWLPHSIVTYSTVCRNLVWFEENLA